MTATQRSRLALLKLVLLGSIALPLLAVSGGAAVFGDAPAPGKAGTILLQAPPPIVLMALGLAMVGFTVGRRHRKKS